MGPETILIVLAALGLAGIFGFLVLFSILFTSIGKNVGDIAVSEAVPSVKNPQFIANLATISGGQLHHFDESKCEIFTDNEIYFERLLADIAKAKDNICIVTYVWEYDEYSKEFFNSLKEAAERGVKVRLLIDAHGSTVKDKTLEKLRNAGLMVSVFRPFRLGKLTLYYARVHRRAYIFDGKVGYFGGAAISRQWFKRSLPNDFVYHDVMYRVRGSLVEPIAGSFGELWSTCANNIAQDMYLLEENPISRQSVNAVTLSHIPRIDVHPLTNAFWYICMAAQEEISLVTPYFVPGKALADLLCQKARSGVRIKIVTQGTKEIWPVQIAARSYYAELLDAGVEIFEHQVPHLHTKILIIDNHFTLAGSANFDIRSQRINHEFVAGVQSSEFATKNKELLQAYEADLKQVDAEAWHHRPLYKRVVEKIMLGLSEQF